jgi:hypothetical protein
MGRGLAINQPARAFFVECYRDTSDGLRARVAVAEAARALGNLLLLNGDDVDGDAVELCDVSGT